MAANSPLVQLDTQNQLECRIVDNVLMLKLVYTVLATPDFRLWINTESQERSWLFSSLMVLLEGQQKLIRSQC